MKRTCPLCSQPLSIEPDYIHCPTWVKLAAGSTPHYNEYDNKTVWYIPPYRITNKGGESMIAIYQKVVLKPRSVGATTAFAASLSSQFFFKHILAVPELHPDTPDKVLERIKTLLVFL
jgi:hypothetical protein